MASASSSSIQKSYKFDVFLSFRGEDTRKNFVDHLYYVLEQRSIHTYMDDPRIKKGKEISDELIKSIEESKFHIIVFSKNYASSSWCLDELVKIMECHKKIGQTAYPVFYDVEPSEVRKQSGAVGEAFLKCEKDERAVKWRRALKEAADLAGWELKEIANGHEAKLIKKIVEEISLELRSINFIVDGKLVGMKVRVNDAVSLLEIGFNDVRMMGIKGIGGGGKTTLARAVFDQISTYFEAKSFIENVREVSKASVSGLKKLQKQILLDVVNEHITFSSVYDGKNMMKRRMCGRKVLLVLDDVDHINQLDALAGEPCWFKPGSRVIITTRDEQVLVAHGVSLIRDVNLLSHSEALCLFSRYAFGRGIPIQGYAELSRMVVCYAAGLPLTIRVLGSFLCGKTDIEWRDALERLKTIPLKETLDKLELSYISLEEDYKDIFLDVACLLKGWPKDAAIRVLESCGFHARNGLKVLEQKSLINIIQNEYLGMHDHIEEMGMNIVRRSHPNKPCNHSRLWIEKEIKDVFVSELGTEATRCIKLSMSNLTPLIVMKGLGNMKELRYLDVGSGSYDPPFGFLKHGHASQYLSLSRCYGKFDEVSQYLPNTLRFTCWKAYPLLCFPKTFRANNLVGLEMPNSKIVQLWEGEEIKVLNKLRFLDLRGSMLRTCDLEMTPNLETLNLKGCRDLVELHMPVGCLNLISLDLSYSTVRTLDLALTPNLERLNLKSCKDLVKINAPVGCLKRLVYLDLTDSGRFNYFEFDKQSIDSFPELHLIAESTNTCPYHSQNNMPKFRFTFYYKEHSETWIGNLEKLISLGLCACTNREIFSLTICSLRLLRKLTLEGTISEVPNDIGQLECLEELVLVTRKITKLPDSICMLKHIKSLKLKCCRLVELPENFGQLRCLEKLSVSSEKIQHLPDNICLLQKLKSFKLKFCQRLEKLPDNVGQLRCLEKFSVSSEKIQHLPDSICLLKQLKSFKLSCQRLEKLLDKFGQLEFLEKLNVRCEMIRHLPDSICLLKQLKSFKLFCQRLEKLPDIVGQIQCLEKLSFRCEKIQHLPDSICLLKQLKSFKLKFCRSLEKLPDNFGQLESLDELVLLSSNITYLPDSICMLKCLKSLSLKECWALDNLPNDFCQLDSLEKPVLASLKIDHLAYHNYRLNCLKSLKLDLLEWTLQDLGRLENLEELILSYSCFDRLPDSILMIKHLKSLKLTACDYLEKLPEDLDRLECLEELIIKACVALEYIPNNIWKMKCLKLFHLPWCFGVKKLPEELGRLECLKELNITGTSIVHLPRSIHQLKGLRIIGSRWLLVVLGFEFKIQESEYETFCYV